MTVKEVAKAFDMSVNQLVMISGYTRQGLYDVIGRKGGKKVNRFNAFIDHLSIISKSKYQQDIAEAIIQANTRDKILEILKEQINE